jgi:hypothetical protein
VLHVVAFTLKRRLTPLCSFADDFDSPHRFLIQSYVGVLLIKQPFFIRGIEDVEVAKGSAFGAAGTFFFTFLVSVFYLLKEGRQLSGSAVAEGRGSVQRFGEYSTVEFVESNDPDHSNNSEGSWT